MASESKADWGWLSAAYSDLDSDDIAVGLCTCWRCSVKELNQNYSPVEICEDERRVTLNQNPQERP